MRRLEFTTLAENQNQQKPWFFAPNRSETDRLWPVGKCNNTRNKKASECIQCTMSARGPANARCNQQDGEL